MIFGGVETLETLDSILFTYRNIPTHIRIVEHVMLFPNALSDGNLQRLYHLARAIQDEVYKVVQSSTVAEYCLVLFVRL